MSMYKLLATLSEGEIDYVLIGDLIVLKTGTGRNKDVLDIEELRKIKLRLGDGQHGGK